MATYDDVSTDVNMASLAGGMQALSTGVQSLRAELTAMQNRETTGMHAIRAELTALQNLEGIQNLSLNERGREQSYQPLPRCPSTTQHEGSAFLEPSGGEFFGLAIPIPGHRWLPSLVRWGVKTTHVHLHEGHCPRVGDGHPPHRTGNCQGDPGRVPALVPSGERLAAAASSICLCGPAP